MTKEFDFEVLDQLASIFRNATPQLASTPWSQFFPKHTCPRTTEDGHLRCLGMMAALHTGEQYEITEWGTLPCRVEAKKLLEQFFATHCHKPALRLLSGKFTETCSIRLSTNPNYLVGVTGWPRVANILVAAYALQLCNKINGDDLEYVLDTAIEIMGDDIPDAGELKERSTAVQGYIFGIIETSYNGPLSKN